MRQRAPAEWPRLKMCELPVRGQEPSARVLPKYLRLYLHYLYIRLNLLLHSPLLAIASFLAKQGSR